MFIGKTLNFHPRDFCVIDNSLSGQAWTDLVYLLFDTLNDRQRILAVTSHNNTADSLCSAFVKGAAAKGRPQRNMSYILNVQRNILVDLDYRIADVFDVLNKTQPANNVLDPVDLDSASPHVDVGHLDSLEDLVQVYPVGPHGIGIDIDLIFLHEPAHRGHLRHAAG